MPQLPKAVVRFVHIMMIVSLVGQVLMPVVNATEMPLQVDITQSSLPKVTRHQVHSQPIDTTIQTETSNASHPQQSIITSTAIVAASYFDSSTEGWTVTEDGENPPSHHADGYIQTDDKEDGIAWYWVAPEKFLNDKSSVYGGYLAFDLRQSSDNNQLDRDDIILVGNGLTLFLRGIGGPGTSWTHYKIALDESVAWKNETTNELATPADIVSVLSSLTALRIRGEYFTGPDTGYLDNVVLYKAAYLPPDQALSPRECPVCSNANLINFPGGPINTRTGNYNYETTDLSIPTVGQPLRFERTYNSDTAIGTGISETVVYSKPLGYGWTHNYDIDLTLPYHVGGEPDTVILKAPHGSRMRFRDNGDGTHNPYPGVWAQMTQTGINQYVVTTTNQTVYTFEPLYKDEVIIQYRFDNPGDLEDWEGCNGLLTKDETKGNPPGSLELYENSNDSGCDDEDPTTFWKAPPNLVNAISYGTHLHFDIWVEVQNSTDHVEVFLEGNGSGINFSVTDPVINEWTPIEVRIDEFADWRIRTSSSGNYDPNAPIATKQDILNILSSLDKVGINGDFDGTLGNSGYLDNVVLLVGSSHLPDLRPRLTSIRDPQGNVTTLNYDANGHLEKVSDPTDTRYLEFTHDSEGRLTQIEDHATRTMHYGYDTLGNLTVFTDTRGLAWDYTYLSGTKLLHEVIDPDGKVLERTFYDGDNDANRQEVGSGADMYESVNIDYTDPDNPIVTEMGVTITDAYNDQGILASQTDADGTHTFGFGPSFERDTVKDANENTTTYDVRPDGLTNSITDADNNTTTFTYDANNNLKSSTDALGRTTDYLYDSQNRLISTTNALDYTTIYTYNTAGQVTEVEDERHNVTKYEYDGFGNRTKITDADNNITTFGYDDLGRVVTTTEPLASNGQLPGKVTINEYDAGNNLIRVTENYLAGQPQNHQNEFNLITEYAYDGAGRRFRTTDTLGRVTENIYDAAGRLDKTIQNKHPSNTTPNYLNEYNLTTTFGYDSDGLQDSVIDPLGHETKTFFDDVGRVKRTIVNYDTSVDSNGDYNPNFPDTNIETEYDYDAVGNQTHVTDTLGRVTYTKYDDLNRVDYTIVNYDQSVNGGDYDANVPDTNIKTDFGYDDVGNQVLITDTLGRVTKYDYDDLNRVETIMANYVDGGPVDNKTNIATHYTYDAAGNQETVTDALSRVTFTEYDNLNRIDTVTANYVDGGPVDDETNVKTITTYDDLSRRVSVQDANDHITLFDYDTLGRTLDITDAENNVTSFTYDALGNRETTTDAENKVTRSEYDTLNRLIKTTANFVDGGPIDQDTNVATEFTYDALSRRISVTDANTHTTTFGYDALGRTLAITDPLTHKTTFTYDGLGNQITVTNAETETTTNQYDDLNRLINVIDPLGHITEFQYNGVGERTFLIDAETVKTHYQYDNLSRLTTVIENHVTGTQGSIPDEDITTVYTYDAVGNRTGVTNALQHTTVYTYDKLNRLEKMADPLGNETVYGYDPVGNRTSMLDANGTTTTFIYDDANRLTDIQYTDNTPNVIFTYNGIGNRLTMTDGTGQTSYIYDDLHRLTSVNDGAGQTVGYQYDAVGNRRFLYYPQDTVEYQYDAANRLDLVIDWDSGQYDYVYDDANRLKTLTFPNGVVSTYTYDDAGRLTNLTHIQGSQTLASYEYQLDKVGNRRVATETLAIPAQAVAAMTEAPDTALAQAEVSSTQFSPAPYAPAAEHNPTKPDNTPHPYSPTPLHPSPPTPPLPDTPAPLPTFNQGLDASAPYPAGLAEIGIQLAQITNTVTLTGATTPAVEPTPVPLEPPSEDGPALVPAKQQDIETEENKHYFPLIFRNAPGTVYDGAQPPVIQQPDDQVEYVITSRDGPYKAKNKANRFEALFEPDGLTLISLEDKQPWVWSMALTDYGFEDESLRHILAAATPDVGKDTITFNWPALRTNFRNTRGALNQKLTLHIPPPASDDVEWGPSARLYFMLDGNLHPTLVDDAQTMHLLTTDGAPAVQLTDLRVTDAAGNNLPAQFELGNDQLAIRIEAKGTTTAYPLTLAWKFKRLKDRGQGKPTAIANPQLSARTSSGDVIYINPKSSITNIDGNGLAIRWVDIGKYDVSSDTWSMYFDGSDVGANGAGMDGFTILSDNSILISYQGDLNLPNVGDVKDEDIVRFVPTMIGENTAGTFQMYLDGSTVGLNQGSEDIDAIAIAPDGRLLVSVNGTFDAPGVSNGKDEDLFAFDDTNDTWNLYFDGSTVDLDASDEDIGSAWVDSGTGDIYFSTVGQFSVPGVSDPGSNYDRKILRCASPACTYSLYWNGDTEGVSKGITGLHIELANGSAPQADFTANPTSGVEPVQVTFTDQSIGQVLTYTWNFGDGNTSSLANPSHTYSTAGTYTVSLTVANNNGSDTETKTSYITVNPPTGNAPVANFTATPLSGNASLTVTFSNTSTDADTYLWDLGDGNTDTITNPVHTYNVPGNYTVVLTATGPGGSDTLTRTSYITVNNPQGGDVIYLVPEATVTLGGTVYEDEDIVAYDLNSGTWSPFFDGSAVGLTDPSHKISAMLVQTDSILMAFWDPVTVPGLTGIVDDSDIVKYTPSTGLFSWYFDGSDVNLGTTNHYETLDAIALAPDGRLVISVASYFNNNDLNNSVTGQDEDLIIFTGTLGSDITSGTWERYFDGSDIGLVSNDSYDITGLWIDDSTGDIYLTHRLDDPSSVTVSSQGTTLTVNRGDVYVCHSPQTGNNTQCTFDPIPYWEGSTTPIGSTHLHGLSIGAGAGNPPTTYTLTTRVITYDYDELYRLTDADYDTGETYDYTYDAVGNRKTQAINGQPATVYTHDIANRLTAVDAQSYTWDNNGNLLNDGTRTFAYDAANRLTDVTSGGTTTQFTYNGAGNRQTKTVAGTVISYTQDVAGGLPQVLIETSSGQSSTYLTGLAQRQGAAMVYNLTDVIGSVRQVSQANGEVTLAQSYDPFGGVLSQNGTGMSGFGYTGQQEDASTGLVFLRARYYDPSIGIFLSRDPVDGEPPYLYARGNPVNLVDLSGTFPAHVIQNSFRASRTGNPHSLRAKFRNHPGLYRLLLAANHNDVIRPMIVDFTPHHGPYSRYPLKPAPEQRTGTVTCDEGQLYVDYWGRRGKLGSYLTTLQAYDHHYYRHERNGNLLNYYDDFGGQKVLPDVIGRSAGGTIKAGFGAEGSSFIDRYGNRYASAGATFGLSFKVPTKLGPIADLVNANPFSFVPNMEGYWAQGGIPDEQALKDTMTEWGFGTQASIIKGVGTSEPLQIPTLFSVLIPGLHVALEQAIPSYGDGFDWYSYGVQAGISVNLSRTRFAGKTSLRWDWLEGDSRKTKSLGVDQLPQGPIVGNSNCTCGFSTDRGPKAAY